MPVHNAAFPCGRRVRDRILLMSSEAEKLAEKLARGMGDKVLFVATAEAKDRDMARRIAAHRLRRPPSWVLLEEPVDIAGRLARGREGSTPYGRVAGRLLAITSKPVLFVNRAWTTTNWLTTL